VQGFPIIPSSSSLFGCPRGELPWLSSEHLANPQPNAQPRPRSLAQHSSAGIFSSQKPQLGIASRSAAAGWPDTHPYHARQFGELLCSYTDAVTLTWVLSSRCSDFPDSHGSSASSCLSVFRAVRRIRATLLSSVKLLLPATSDAEERLWYSS
jgi:hypothetical protein